MRTKGMCIGLAALLMVACGEPQGLPSAGAGDDPVGFAKPLPKTITVSSSMLLLGWQLFHTPLFFATW